MIAYYLMVIILKKIKLITILITFLLSFLFHFGYDLSNNVIFSIIFPVNESIWEHMKIVATPILISSIIEYFILIKNNIKTNNYSLGISISIIISIIFYLIIYLPIDYIFGHNLIVAITILLITFIFSENIKQYIIHFKKINHQKIIGMLLIVIIYSIFGYLTYNPIQNNLFRDPQCNCYGIKK